MPNQPQPNDYVPVYHATDVRQQMTECIQALSGTNPPKRQPITEQNMATFPASAQPQPPISTGSEWLPEQPTTEFTDMTDGELGKLFREEQARSLDDFAPGTQVPMTAASFQQDSGFFFQENSEGTFDKMWKAPNGVTYKVQLKDSADLQKANLAEQDDLQEQMDLVGYDAAGNAVYEDEDGNYVDEAGEVVEVEELFDEAGEPIDMEEGYTEALEQALLDLIAEKKGKKSTNPSMAAILKRPRGSRGKGKVKDPQKLAGYIRWHRDEADFEGKDSGEKWPGNKPPKSKDEHFSLDQLAELDEEQYEAALQVLTEARKAKGHEPQEEQQTLDVDGYSVLEHDGEYYLAIPEDDLRQLFLAEQEDLEMQAEDLPEGAIEDLRMELAIEKARSGGSISEALSAALGTVDFSQYDKHIGEDEETYIILPLDEYQERFTDAEELDEELDEEDDDNDEPDVEERALVVGRQKRAGKRVRGGKVVYQKAGVRKKKTGKAKMAAIRALMKARRGTGKMKAIKSRRRGRKLGLY